MNEPKVTVGIPFYNDEDYLALAIQSVCNQSYKDWQLILMDDGSTDNSLKIAQKFKEKDNRISVFSDGNNKKLSTRLNQISKLAETTYLARMDADDVMHPHRLKTQIQILEDNPDIDVLGTNIYSIDGNNKIQGIRLKDNLPESIINFDFDIFVHPSVMAKTKWFLENPYDEKVGKSQDFELWHRTKDTYNLKVYSEPLLFYREYGGAYYKKYFKGINSSFYFARKWKSSRLLVKAFFKVFKSFGYYFFYLFGQEDFLLKNRYEALNNPQKKHVQDILNDILF